MSGQPVKAENVHISCLLILVKRALLALAGFRAPVRMGVSLQVYAIIYREIHYIQITSRRALVIGQIPQDILIL
jgi:hypothetical protein